MGLGRLPAGQRTARLFVDSQGGLDLAELEMQGAWPNAAAPASSIEVTGGRLLSCRCVSASLRSFDKLDDTTAFAISPLAAAFDWPSRPSMTAKRSQFSQSTQPSFSIATARIDPRIALLVWSRTTARIAPVDRSSTLAMIAPVRLEVKHVQGDIASGEPEDGKSNTLGVNRTR